MNFLGKVVSTLSGVVPFLFGRDPFLFGVATPFCANLASPFYSVSHYKTFSPPPLFSPNVLEKAVVCTAWKKQKEHLKLCCLQVTNDGQLVGSAGKQGFRIIPSKPHDPISEDGDLGACSHIKFWR